MFRQEVNYQTYLALQGLAANTYRIFIVWWILSEHGKDALSMLFTASTIVGFISLQLLSPLTDVINKKKVLSTLAASLALIFIAIGLLSLYKDTSFYQIAALFLTVTIVSSLSGPVLNAIIPSITAKARVAFLIRRNKMINASIAIAAPFIAGIIGSTEFFYGFILSAACALVCFIISTHINLNDDNTQPAAEQSWLTLIKEG